MFGRREPEFPCIFQSLVTLRPLGCKQGVLLGVLLGSAYGSPNGWDNANTKNTVVYISIPSYESYI